MTIFGWVSWTLMWVAPVAPVIPVIPVLPVIPVSPAPVPPLDDLAWLAGCWESRAGERVTLEMWSPPAGGLMVGTSRTVVSGRARAFEYLRIGEAPDGFVYTAIPSGQSETHFASTSVAEDGFVVENPDHDFPTRITYRRTTSGGFTAMVEGPTADGDLEGFQMEFQRVGCRSPEGQRPE